MQYSQLQFILLFFLPQHRFFKPCHYSTQILYGLFQLSVVTPKLLALVVGSRQLLMNLSSFLFR